MVSDVAAFVQQLKTDGIDAARKDADKILSEAQDKARGIVAEAEAAAKKLNQEAQNRNAQHRQRSEAELKLVSRDLMLAIRSQIERIAADLLSGKVKETLNSGEVVKAALVELLKTQSAGQAWELALGPTVGKSLAKAVVEDLFKAKGAKVKVVEGFAKAGFQLRSKGGTEVLEVSEDSVTEAFRRLLSPELVKILELSGPKSA